MDEQNNENHSLITTVYDINRAIFRHLPIRSIDFCALVCQTWGELARQTRSNRRTIHALTYPINPLSETDDGQCLLSDFNAYCSSFIDDRLWSIPYLVFVVATNNLEKNGFQSSSNSPPPSKTLKRLRSQRRAGRGDGLNIPQAVVQHLSKSSQLLMIASEGIIATNEENQVNEIESGDAMGILLLPKLPSNILGIYPFEIPSRTVIPADISRESLHQLLGDVPADVPIRCILFFLIRPHNHANILLKKLLQYHSPNIVIIGGFIDKIHYNNRQDPPRNGSNISGIVLTGDPNHLNIRQVVLPSDVHQREDIQKKLKELKSDQTASTFSFGIQVSCVARGSEFYGNRPNIECSEFRNLYPQTPLIGIFGNGEIGHDYLPKETSLEQNQSLRKEEEEDLFLTYSSVFSLISINL